MLATGLGIKACQAGHRVLFATAAAWTDRLTTAHRAWAASRPRSPAWAYSTWPPVIDEIGYIPFEPEAASLFFELYLSPLRDRKRHRHQQQALQLLGRHLRRQHRRRRHDRPPRPSR